MMADISRTDLTTIPPDIWHELSSYLDTGDFVSLAAVNKSLRLTLTSNTRLLSFLLRHRMKIKWPSRRKRTPYEEIVFHIPKRRCQGCRGMEYIPSNLKWNSLFRMKLCSDCRQSERFRMITSKRAKSEYKLNETDLSCLQELLATNPHCRGGPPMRLYSLAEIVKASHAKMEAKGTTLEATRKAQVRGEAVKRGKLGATEKRRIALIDALAAVGLGLDDCRCGALFIEQMRHPKFTLEQTVEQAVHQHNIECHIATDRMRDYVDNSQDDNLWHQYGFGLGELQLEALEILRVVEKEMEGVDSGSLACKCGRRYYHDRVFDHWRERYSI